MVCTESGVCSVALGNGTFTNVMFGAASISGGIDNFHKPGAWNKFSHTVNATTGSLSIVASMSGNQSMANALQVANISSSLTNLATNTYQIGTGVRDYWDSRNNAVSGQYEPSETTTVIRGQEEEGDILLTGGATHGWRP